MPECPQHSIFNSYVVWASRTLFQEKCGYETILFETLLTIENFRMEKLVLKCLTKSFAFP